MVFLFLTSVFVWYQSGRIDWLNLFLYSSGVCYFLEKQGVFESHHLSAKSVEAILILIFSLLLVLSRDCIVLLIGHKHRAGIYFAQAFLERIQFLVRFLQV
jgi:hypothetical protein